MINNKHFYNLKKKPFFKQKLIQKSCVLLMKRTTGGIIAVCFLCVVLLVGYYSTSTTLLISDPAVWSQNILNFKISANLTMNKYDMYLWDKTSIIPGPSPWTEACQFKEINAKGQKFNMCIRTYDDVVSNTIRNNGRWSDCDSLLDLWKIKPTAALDVIASDPV